MLDSRGGILSHLLPASASLRLPIPIGIKSNTILDFRLPILARRKAEWAGILPISSVASPSQMGIIFRYISPSQHWQHHRSVVSQSAWQEQSPTRDLKSASH